jgi:hypothetical protein
MKATTDKLSPPIAPARPARSRWRPMRWLWFAARNLIGWVLILIAVPVGVSIPIPLPLGFTLFIIGTAMVWLPGKRPMVARILAGKPIARQSIRASLFKLVMALGIPAATMLAIGRWSVPAFAQPLVAQSWRRGVLAMLLALAAWRASDWFMIALSHMLRFVPSVRRKIRPMLHRRGIRGGPRARIRRPTHKVPIASQPAEPCIASALLLPGTPPA